MEAVKCASKSNIKSKALAKSRKNQGKKKTEKNEQKNQQNNLSGWLWLNKKLNSSSKKFNSKEANLAKIRLFIT